MGHMGDGWGWWMLFSLVWSGLFLAAVVWALLVPLERRDRRTQISSAAPLEILESRYAAGELNDEQFEQMRRRLQRPAGG